MVSIPDPFSDSMLAGIGAKLRAAREASDRSVEDIAARTHINRRFLEDIERGVVPHLPQTYIRAFIRSYAQALDLDGDALLQDAGDLTPRHEPSSPAEPVEVAAVTKSTDQKAYEKRGQRQGMVLIVLAALLIAGLVLLVIWMRQDRSVSPTQEISFSDVVRQYQSKQGVVTSSADSVSRAANSASVVQARDSLNLEGIAIDSVWVQIVIDGTKSAEYTLTPLYRMHWKAARSFLVSVGNGSGISFTMNGKRLGSLGPSKKPVKNFALSWETLKKIR